MDSFFHMQGSGRIGFMFDWTYILILIGVAICLLASARVKIAFNKYNQVRTLSGITGSQAARIILDKAGLNYIQIERVSGDLTDHYDPKSKVLRLSQSVYDSPSVAAVGVAAHECGHAVQDAENYGPLALRTTAVPVAQFSSWIYWPLIIVGWVSGWVGLADLGILVFSFVVLFQLITLPVEFNASSRALRVLGSGEDIFRSREEYEGARSVLKAAALTYVASLISTVLQLARLVLINRRRK